MFADLPVRYKITGIAVAITAIVLLFASAFFVALEINNYRRALEQELTAIAQITSSNSTAAIIFNDATAAQETLEALAARPNIESATLYASDGRLLARHGVPLTPIDLSDGALSGELSSSNAGDDPRYRTIWSWRSLDLYGPIEFDGETIGAIHLRSSLQQIHSTTLTYLGVVLVVVAISIILAWLLAARLQRQVTMPIHGLLATMQLVSREHDYAQRAQKYGDDELGALVDGFNEMLAETEAHRRELNAARREAEAASRMKSEFLAHMSHELRTPLNAILGFSDFMLTEPLGPLGDSKYREYMESIRSGGQHLLTVINDILDLSKIEAGAVVLSEEIFDIETLVDDCNRMLRDAVIKAAVDLKLEVDTGLPHVYGDPGLIKRSLLNLLSNALKFTPAGGEICIIAHIEPGGDFAISVRDTGVGIAADKLDYVLAPFGQAENVLKRTHDGTGLGLPLVKSFVELHGGHLQLQSIVGLGTEVTMRLPGSRARLRPISRSRSVDTIQQAAQGDGAAAVTTVQAANAPGRRAAAASPA